MKKSRWTLHDVAAMAEALAEALRALPNAPLVLESDRARVRSDDMAPPFSPSSSAGTLSKVDLIKLIHQEQLPVSASAKDSTRKIVGRVVSYLRKNSEIADRVLGPGSRSSANLQHTVQELRALVVVTPPRTTVQTQRSGPGHIADLPKAELIALIERERLPVAVSSKDSAKKISSRMASYLRQHPEAAERILGSSSRGSRDLARALQALRNMAVHGSATK